MFWFWLRKKIFYLVHTVNCAKINTKFKNLVCKSKVELLKKGQIHLEYSKNLCKTTAVKKQLVFKTNYGLMQVKSIAECSKGSILQLLTFIRLPFVQLFQDIYILVVL